MGLRTFRINWIECDHRPKSRLKDWLEVLHTVYRYAKADGLGCFAEYLKLIYDEVSENPPYYPIYKKHTERISYLGREERLLSVIQNMKDTLTSHELEDAKKWLSDLQQSDFFKLLEERKVFFHRAMLKRYELRKRKLFYNEFQRSYLDNLLIQIRSSIEYLIQNL